MKLIFKNSGPTENFSNWLKQFKDISSSILIEVDLEERKFIAKSYTEDKALIRYSFITFDECNLKVDSMKDDSNKKMQSLDGKRVKVGIFLILPKFITVVDTFSPVDHSIEFLFQQVETESGETEYHSQAMVFKSKTLKMRVEECSISEFQEISDHMFFNQICSTADPIKVNISAESVKNLTNISNIFTLDSNRDHMMFYFTDDKTLNVKNPEESLAGRSGSYDYTLGVTENEDNYDLSDVKLNILRSRFLMAVKNNSGDNFDLVISTDMSRSNRIIFEGKNTVTVIAILKI